MPYWLKQWRHRPVHSFPQRRDFGGFMAPLWLYFSVFGGRRSRGLLVVITHVNRLPIGRVAENLDANYMFSSSAT